MPTTRRSQHTALHGSSLVTRNLRHFERVPDLEVEDWWKIS